MWKYSAKDKQDFPLLRESSFLINSLYCHAFFIFWPDTEDEKDKCVALIAEYVEIQFRTMMCNGH